MYHFFSYCNFFNKRRICLSSWWVPVLVRVQPVFHFRLPKLRLLFSFSSPINKLFFTREVEICLLWSWFELKGKGSGI